MPSTAEPEAKLAVMVWIHGGRFALGSSSHYPGGVLAAFNDVIVVSLNYRLGILGFLNVPGTEVKGNYGIMDQVGNLTIMPIAFLNIHLQLTSIEFYSLGYHRLLCYSGDGGGGDGGKHTGVWKSS